MSKKTITDADWNIVLLKLTALRGDLRGLEWKAAQDLQRLGWALTPRISKLEAHTTGTTPDHSSLRERIARLEKMVAELTKDAQQPTQGLNGPDSEVQMACDPTDPTRPTGRLDDAKTEYQIPRVPNVGESVKFSPEEIKRTKDQLDYRTRLINEIDELNKSFKDFDDVLAEQLEPTQTLTTGPRLWRVALRCCNPDHKDPVDCIFTITTQIRARSITAAVSLVYEQFPGLSGHRRVISVTEVEE